MKSLSRQSILISIVALGAVFLALSYFLTRNDSDSGLSGTRLATVLHETGRVEIVRNGLGVRTKVEDRAELGPLDSVETFEIGEANLHFENGFHVRVFANSLLTLERVNEAEGYHINLIVQRGDLRVDQLGREHELIISKNGEKIAAELFNDSQLKKTPIKLTTSAVSETIQPLTEEEIAITLNQHRPRFFRCYTHLAQSNPQIKGEAQLAFTIDNAGHVAVLDIGVHLMPTPTSVIAGDFKKCLQDVISRIEFRAFSGPTVSTVFPLQFD